MNSIDAVLTAGGRRRAPNAVGRALTVDTDGLVDGIAAAHAAHHSRTFREGLHVGPSGRGGGAADFLTVRSKKSPDDHFTDVNSNSPTG